MEFLESMSVWSNCRFAVVSEIFFQVDYVLFARVESVSENNFNPGEVKAVQCVTKVKRKVLFVCFSDIRNRKSSNNSSSQLRQGISF